MWKPDIPEDGKEGGGLRALEKVVDGARVVKGLEMSLTGGNSVLGLTVPGGVKLEEHPEPE